MFVQEEKIFAGKVLRLHICASDGAEWLEEATEDTAVEQLKERCLKHVRPPRPGLPPAQPPPARRGSWRSRGSPGSWARAGDCGRDARRRARQALLVSRPLGLLALGVRPRERGAVPGEGGARRGDVPSPPCGPARGPAPGSGRSCRRTGAGPAAPEPCLPEAFTLTRGQGPGQGRGAGRRGVHGPVAAGLLARRAPRVAHVWNESRRLSLRAPPAPLWPRKRCWAGPSAVRAELSPSPRSPLPSDLPCANELWVVGVTAPEALLSPCAAAL